MKKVIKIAIAEDHDLVRQGLVAMLKEYEDLQIVFDVRNGKEVLLKLKTYKPNILLLDIEMPEMGGMEVFDKIKVKYPEVKVILISAYSQNYFINEFYKQGVSAFLPKESKISKVVKAIHSVYDTGQFIDKSLNIKSKDEIAAKKTTNNLTVKELAVLNLLCKGKTSGQAAEILGLTVYGVDFHSKNILRKTNTKNRAALIVHAIQTKLIK